MPRLIDEKEIYGRALTVAERAQKATVVARMRTCIVTDILMLKERY